MTVHETTTYPTAADQLRHDISRGSAGDQVDHPDVAAAPLGTDDEAAGNPASSAELRMAAADTPPKPPEESAFGAASLYAAVVIAILAVVGASALAFS